MERERKVAEAELTGRGVHGGPGAAAGRTGWSKWILHRKLMYSMRFLTDVIVKIEQHISTSCVKFSWTTL